MLLFYIFFEMTLIPMLMLIVWWGPNKRKMKAAKYLFMYTLFGSVPLLLGVLKLYTVANTTSYYGILGQNFSLETQTTLVTLFFLGFMVKIPVFPFHIWLP